MKEVWNHQDSSKRWPPGKTEQSRENGLGQRGDQEPDGHSDRAPEFLGGDGRTLNIKLDSKMKPRYSFQILPINKNNSLGRINGSLREVHTNSLVDF